MPAPSPEFDRLEPRLEPDGLRTRDRRSAREQRRDALARHLARGPPRHRRPPNRDRRRRRHRDPYARDTDRARRPRATRARARAARRERAPPPPPPRERPGSTRDASARVWATCATSTISTCRGRASRRAPTSSRRRILLRTSTRRPRRPHAIPISISTPRRQRARADAAPRRAAAGAGASARRAAARAAGCSPIWRSW